MERLHTSIGPERPPHTRRAASIGLGAGGADAPRGESCGSGRRDAEIDDDARDGSAARIRHLNFHVCRERRTDFSLLGFSRRDGEESWPANVGLRAGAYDRRQHQRSATDEPTVHFPGHRDLSPLTASTNIAPRTSGGKYVIVAA